METFEESVGGEQAWQEPLLLDALPFGGEGVGRKGSPGGCRSSAVLELEQQGLELGEVFAAVVLRSEACEGMLVGMAGELEDGIELGEFIAHGVEVALLAALGEVKRNFDGAGIGQGEVAFDAVVEREAAGTLAMNGLHVAVELLSQDEEFLAALLEVLADVAVGDVECLLQLLEEMGLGDFVGMELQAEGVEAYLGQTLLHDAECRHLLGHEQYALALVEGIGNHIGDGLGLTGSRRTIEDEALGESALDDGFELRGVHGNGGGHVGRLGSEVEVPGIHVVACFGQDESAFYQTLHDGALLELGGVGVDIVPHDKLVEGEQPEDALVEHFPAGVLGDGLADGI